VLVGVVFEEEILCKHSVYFFYPLPSVCVFGDSLFSVLELWSYGALELCCCLQVANVIRFHVKLFNLPPLLLRVR
jgi:hypothetical protein